MSSQPVELLLRDPFFSSVVDPVTMLPRDRHRHHHWGHPQFDMLELPHRFARGARSLSPLGTVTTTETDMELQYKVDAPGLSADNLNVDVADDGTLTVSGNQHSSEEIHDETKHVHRMHRSEGTFRRTFHLPDNAKLDSITADITDGVLCITVPKTLTAALKHEERHLSVPTFSSTRSSSRSSRSRSSSFNADPAPSHHCGSSYYSSSSSNSSSSSFN